MSGVKRVNAALGMYAAPSKIAERAHAVWRAHESKLSVPSYWRAKRTKKSLPVQSRYRDVRCFLRGGVLHVESIALKGTVQLPERINTKARALDLLAVEEKYEDGEFVFRLKHPVLKYVLEPWLSQDDLAGLSKAVDDLPFTITQSVQGIALHECVAMNQRCFCLGFKCPTHQHWEIIAGESCACMDDRRMARDAVAVFDADNNQLRIDSASFPELWITVTLPLCLEPKGDDGLLVLTPVRE